MYKTIAKRKVRRLFEDLSDGDWPAAMKDVHPEVHHVFPGDHAIGGERHTSEAMARWFERVYRLFPGLTFEVKHVAVRGAPWDLWVAVEWRDWGDAADGGPYRNEGAHWIRIVRGKARYVHAYLDTQAVAATCERLAAAGVEEAAQPPITG